MGKSPIVSKLILLRFKQRAIGCTLETSINNDTREYICKMIYTLNPLTRIRNCLNGCAEIKSNITDFLSISAFYHDLHLINLTVDLCNAVISMMLFDILSLRTSQQQKNH